jgi:uncharacterized membrane protein YczE
MKERQKLTIGEWMIFVSACAVLLTMFTPIIRTWTQRDVTQVVVILAIFLVVLSPMFILGCVSRNYAGRAIDGRVWMTAYLSTVALFSLARPIVYSLTRIVRQWKSPG